MTENRIDFRLKFFSVCVRVCFGKILSSAAFFIRIHFQYWLSVYDNIAANKRAGREKQGKIQLNGQTVWVFGERLWVQWI